MQPEIKWKPSKALTPKRNAYVRYRVEHPLESNTDAVMATHNVKKRSTAGLMAKQLNRIPAVQAELARYSTTAELNIIKLANAATEFAMQGGKDGAAYASVAEKTNNSILDRLHGKATTKIEQTTQAVVINIDLTANT